MLLQEKQCINLIFLTIYKYKNRGSKKDNAKVIYTSHKRKCIRRLGFFDNTDPT